MDITFLILFGLSVLAANAIIAGIEDAVKNGFTKGEDKKMTQKTVTLDEFLNERSDFVKQVVYKVDGDFNGNITGDNVTVILMGDGDINGDINARDGEVVLIRGDINGNVKADKVICPSLSNTHTQVDAKCSECEFSVKRQIFISIHGISECYECNKFNESFDDDRPACQEFKYRNPAKDVKSPELPTKNSNKTCYECIHCQHSTNTPMCKLTNQIIRWWTPCACFERRYK